jgi:3-phenylpropionate/trans-cinnamate dioxygenase ferredoxin reductase subunit
MSTKAEKFVINDDGNATSIILEDGTSLPTDMVVFGIGIIPETGPLLAEGAMGGNGVDVDDMCRTNLPDIYAIGDCANHANRYANGAHVRLESVQNAHDQAKTVAGHICGQDQPYNVVPWFWSNQYDVKLQTIGFSLGYDEEICRGDPESNSFSVIYRLDGKVIAVDCVNRTKDYVQGKKLIENGDILDAEQLADTDIPFKEVGLA